MFLVWVCKFYMDSVDLTLICGHCEIKFIANQSMIKFISCEMVKQIAV